MYHEVPAVPPYGYFAVSRDRFAAQLDLLVALRLAVRPLESAGPGQVALTFDDGHVSHYTEVFPLLAACGMRATFFVTTDWVGRPGYVTWDQLREMANAGMSIQSHTASHPFLSELDRAEGVRELITSKERIEASVGQACVSIALPGGDAPRGWKSRDYAALGFRWVATSRWGPNSTQGSAGSTVLARRYTVRRDTSDERLRVLALGRSPATDLEGLRLLALKTLRVALGPSRYARVRRRVLGASAAGGQAA